MQKKNILEEHWLNGAHRRAKASSDFPFNVSFESCRVYADDFINFPTCLVALRLIAAVRISLISESLDFFASFFLFH